MLGDLLFHNSRQATQMLTGWVGCLHFWVWHGLLWLASVDIYSQQGQLPRGWLRSLELNDRKLELGPGHGEEEENSDISSDGGDHTGDDEDGPEAEQEQEQDQEQEQEQDGNTVL